MAASALLRSWKVARFSLGVAILGFFFSLALGEARDLDTRWLVVVVLGIGAISISMCLARVFSEFLLVISLFCVPIASFAKWFWPSGYADRHGDILFVGLFGLGIIDFVLIGLYVSWGYRIFVLHRQTLPRLNRIDGCVLWLVLAHLLSTVGSEDPVLALESTQFLVKNALFYFYLSRHLEERHLPWLLAAFGFAIFLEAGLGSYQFATGKLLGIALDKGAGGADLDFQAVVPGTEGYHRATGTSYDAHTLGHLVAMMLPFPLVMCFSPRLRLFVRLGCMAASGAAILVILLSLSRSAWAGSLISLAIGFVLMIVLWQERQVVPALSGAMVVVTLMTPFVVEFVYGRFVNSPQETLSVRFDQFTVAWYVFTLFPFFGVGPGNWINVYPRYDFLWLPADDSMSLVHNVILWIAIEVGIFGVIPFLCLLATTMLRLLSLARSRRDVPGRLGLAALIGMMTTVLTGLTDPAYREPNVFLMFWLLVALSVALPRMRRGAARVLIYGQAEPALVDTRAFASHTKQSDQDPEAN